MDFTICSCAAPFALIAYASAYLKAHHPAAFYAAILNSWPMGFYHPATLVKDAQRHGTSMRPIDVARSGWKCRWEEGAVRLGLRFVQGLKEATGKKIEAEQERAPFTGADDLARRCALSEDELVRLAYAGALFAGIATEDPSPLPDMTPREETAADYESTQMTTGPHLVEHLRGEFRRRGIL